MVKHKRVPAARRGTEARIWQAPRGSGKNEPEDDPLRDLRPVDDEPEPSDPDGDEFIWPDLHDENEEDD